LCKKGRMVTTKLVLRCL
nr:immunoglobulin heavy chain junction region [Mus musculus]